MKHAWVGWVGLLFPLLVWADFTSTPPKRTDICRQPRLASGTPLWLVNTSEALERGAGRGDYEARLTNAEGESELSTTYGNAECRLSGIVPPNQPGVDPTSLHLQAGTKYKVTSCSLRKGDFSLKVDGANGQGQEILCALNDIPERERLERKVSEIQEQLFHDSTGCELKAGQILQVAHSSTTEGLRGMQLFTKDGSHTVALAGKTGKITCTAQAQNWVRGSYLPKGLSVRVQGCKAYDQGTVQWIFLTEVVTGKPLKVGCEVQDLPTAEIAERSREFANVILKGYFTP